MIYKDILEKLIGGSDLIRSEMLDLMGAFMQGELTSAQIAGILVALRVKGESTEEIAAAVEIMRKFATRINVDHSSVIDTCGTGGDSAHTFNISTTAAFIAAGAGVTIAKHGNRSVSSKCGSADVLQSLGVNLDITPTKVEECIREIGIGFLFAPKLHPAMKHVMGARKDLGIRTLFNLLGPLTNPAGATRQLIGVFAPHLTEIFAQVLQKLGSERALVVHGRDGLDEITINEKTKISELKNGKITNYELDPLDFFSSYRNLSSIQSNDLESSVKILRQILDGSESPHLDIAVLNASGAIYVSGIADDFGSALELARQSIASGNASKKLEQLIQYTN